MRERARYGASTSSRSAVQTNKIHIQTKRKQKTMFNPIRHITRSTRIMGLLGLLVAAAALSAGTTSASASSINTSNGGSTYGKLNVFAYNAMQAGLGGLANASITVADANGQVIAKGATDSKGLFSNYVQQGTHSIKITAQGFQGFSTQI